MNWYLQSGKESDVVFSAKIMYIRNFRNYRFNITKEEAKKMENEIKDKLLSFGYNLKLLRINDMDDITKSTLVEKNLISKKCKENKYGYNDILVNDEENICIMINEDDHIKLQVFSGGFELEETFNYAKEIDKKIEETFDIAKSEKYGYLTKKLTNVGTGMKVYITLHLPGLKRTANLEKALNTIRSFGVDINSKTSDIYEISNKQTIGTTEEEIINKMKVIVEKVIEQEREARRILAKNQILLEDNVYRSYGLISNCRKITEDETEKLLSDIKLGVDLGIIKEITDSQILKLYLYTKKANLQKKIGQNLDKFDRDIKRSEIIKEIIKS